MARISSKRAGDVAPRELHPDVRHAFENIDFSVAELVDHFLRVVADRIEGFRDLFVALADVHRLRLVANHLVEDFRLAERARNDRDAVLVELGDLFQQGVDRREIGPGRSDSEFAQRPGRLIEILHRRQAF